jgi:hypothetical protein
MVTSLAGIAEHIEGGIAQKAESGQQFKGLHHLGPELLLDQVTRG